MVRVTANGRALHGRDGRHKALKLALQLKAKTRAPSPTRTNSRVFLGQFAQAWILRALRTSIARAQRARRHRGPPLTSSA